MVDGRNSAAAYLEIVPDVPSGLELGLRNYWYPILQTEDLPARRPAAITCLGQDLVVWRDGEGRPCVLDDRCPHRNARLSVGRVLDHRLQCIFHGLRFNGSGECVQIPWEPDDSRLLGEVCVTSYPARELGGYIWCYLGDADKFPPPPLEIEVPEELSTPDGYVCFRLPTQLLDQRPARDARQGRTWANGRCQGTGR